MICSPKEKNIAGQKFGRLTAIKRDFDYQKSVVRWIFRCDCGVIKSIGKGEVVTGRQISCGCAQKEIVRRSITKYHKRKGHSLHGKWNHELYATWSNMKARCNDEANKDYIRYGGRGISVCDRWLDINNFIADMGVKPDGATLDRIDNDGDYEPLNCRWATVLQQSSNRRDNVPVTIKGVDYPSIAEARRKTGLCTSMINREYR